MDCYRILKEDALATLYAQEVLRNAMTFDGTNRSPMRAAEAHITLGVAAARAGELSKAVAHGRSAINGDRKSLPSLAMVAHDLSGLLLRDYPNEPETRDFVDELRNVAVRA